MCICIHVLYKIGSRGKKEPTEAKLERPDVVRGDVELDLDVAPCSVGCGDLSRARTELSVNFVLARPGLADCVLCVGVWVLCLWVLYR